MNKTKKGTLFFSKPLKRDLNVFIVEDVVSAMVVGKTHSACALLRSKLDDEAVPSLLEWLKKIKPPTIIVALDPDVPDKAKSLKKDLTNLFPCVKVLHTRTDPKNWKQEEVEQYGN